MSSSTTETPALLFGAGLTVLGTMRSLGRAGRPVLCAHQQPAFVEASRWCRYPESGTLPLLPDEALPALDASPIAGAVAIPCSDHWIREIASWAPDSPRGRRFRSSLSPPSTLDILVDKGRFAEALRGLGLPHPWTRQVSSDADVAALGDEIPAGSFLKPRDSQAFNRQFQRKAFSTASRQDLLEKLALVRAAGLEVIIQEYIPGPPTNHYFVDGFVDRHGRVTALVARRRIRMYPVDFGNSTMLVSVPLDEVRGAVETMRALTAGLSYRGIFSAEFKKDDRDGLFKILEVNCRPWWFVEFATMCGVNVVRMAYEDALGQPVAPAETYRAGLPYCYLKFDAMAYRHLKSRGELGTVAWVRSWIFGKHAVFSLDDPGPSLQPVRHRAAERWRRIAGRA